MKNLFVLSFITLGFSSQSFAKDFIIGLGGGVLSHSEAEQTATVSDQSLKPILRSYGGGFAHIQLQYIGWPIFDWAVQGYYTFSKGLAHFDYTDGTNRGINERQKTNIAELLFTLGPRLNILTLGNTKTFIGGGGIAGSKVLLHDKTSYLEANQGSSTGFLETDAAGQTGYYAEAGVEYRSTPFAFRLMVQHQELKSATFKTLANQRVTDSQQLYSFNLIQQF